MVRLSVSSIATFALSCGALIVGPMTSQAAADPANQGAQVQHIRAIDTIQRGEGRQFTVVYNGYLPPTNWLPQILGGKASITTRITPESYSVDSRVSAAGIVDWFIDYSSTLKSHGQLTPDGFKPLTYEARDDEGRKNRHTLIEHFDDKVEVAVTPPHGNLGEPPASMEQKLEAIDPISALMSLAINPTATPEDPCKSTLRIFDGKGRYNLHLSFGHRLDSLDAPGWSGPSIVCRVKYEEVAGYKKKTDEQMAAIQRDLRWINIVLADLGPGEPRIPVKIEARSKKRGKITLVAKSLSYGDLDRNKAAHEADIPPRG